MKKSLILSTLILTFVLATSLINPAFAAPKASSNALSKAITSGSVLHVTFDLGYVDDASWTGSWTTDPMGTLQWGQAYDVSYDRNLGWKTVGFNENDYYDYKVLTSNYTYPAKCANPMNNEICMWGRVYQVVTDANNNYVVKDTDYGIVGRLDIQLK